MRLFRPVGLAELLLVHRSGMTAFPPRLPEQPIFYPVLEEPYAVEIARDWNTKEPTAAGFVTEFDVADACASQYPAEQVGARHHRELWVDADRLPDFNRALTAPIRVTAAFYGASYRGVIPDAGPLRGQDAHQQLTTLTTGADLAAVVTANAAAIFASYPFWTLIAAPAARPVLESLSAAWSQAFPALPLGVGWAEVVR